jgi:hypothetical protein
LENDTINQLIHGLWEYPNPPKKYTWKLDTLWYNEYIVLVKNSSLKQKILEEFHSSHVGDITHSPR